MATPPPPPPSAYTVSVTPPNTPTPRPEKRPTPPAFSSPVITRFSPHSTPSEQLHTTPTTTPNSLSPGDGGTALGSPIRQFSTPPGPPVFSSPLRPTAIPLRASPDTPQPVAYQSPALPASPSPDHSIGPTELREHNLASMNESPVDATAPYVLFSSNKVLKYKHLANTSSLGFGALISPGKEIVQGPQVVQRDPHRCISCGAYANLYCSIIIGSGKWQCVICKHLNESEGEYEVTKVEDLHGFMELSSPMVDYIQTANKQPGFFPISGSRLSASIFLVIDECIDEAHLQHLQSSLHAFVDSLSTTTRIGIISYGRTISVYDFSEGSTASADLLPGNRSPTKESLRALIYGTGVYLAPIHASLPVAHSVFSSMRPYRMQLPEASRDRCIGSAVEVALAIIQGPSSEIARGMGKRAGVNCRILVCAGGPNTYGPGSVPHSFTHPNYPYMEKTARKWMEQLGTKARLRGIVVDIFCAGTCPVRVPVLQPLAKASGGVLVLHDDFGEAFGVNLQRASTRAAGVQGLLEIRCSDNIYVTQVIGPGEEATSEAHETFKNDLSTRIQMLSVEETQSFVLSMELRSDVKSDYVFFQFVTHYSNVYRAEIARVITVRLGAADSVSSYLSSIQEEVAAVLMAKRTVLLAKSAPDALVDMYSKCRRVNDARRLFDRISGKNLICWNAMILGHCIHESPYAGIALFEEMTGRGDSDEMYMKKSAAKAQAHLPDEVTFVGLLCACARARLLSEGQRYFSQMTSMYGLKPTFAHYWCMANLYFSCGVPKEVEQVLKKISGEPISVLCSRLLGACRFHGDVELGEHIAKQLIGLDPDKYYYYSLLCTIYAVAGRWESVTRVKMMMRERGMSGHSGSSLIDLNKIVQGFSIGDKSCSELETLYSVMDELASRLDELEESKEVG